MMIQWVELLGQLDGLEHPPKPLHRWHRMPWVTATGRQREGQAGEQLLLAASGTQQHPASILRQPHVSVAQLPNPHLGHRVPLRPWRRG